MCFCCERSPMLDRLTSGLSPAVRGRREFLARAAVAAALGGGAMRRGRAAAPVAAEVIFRGGTIRTMADGRGIVDAVAIGGGRILAAGTVSEANACAGDATRIVELAGRTVLPGLIDPHHHSVLAALLTTLLLDVGPSACRTRADAIAALKARAAKTPAGEWVAAGFYDNLLQGGELTGADLDAVSTSHPIFVLYVNGHVGAANRLAFDRARIPPDVGTLPGGGHFGRGPDGRLDGRIYEQPALLRFTAVALPSPTPAVLANALTAYAKRAAAAGNTTLHEPGTVKPEWVEHLASLSNDLDVRLSASFSTDMVEASKAFAALGPGAKARRIPRSRFSLYGMKFWADGSNQARSAAQTTPYLSTAEQGRTNHSAAEMVELCRAARAAGWSILVHCQGDAAIDAALDGIEEAYGASPATGLNRIEHATMARQDQLERMKRLGVEPSFIPDFVYLYGAAYRDQIFGPKRGEFMVPAAAAERSGVAFTLHSDAPAAGLPINPLRHVQTAVTRRCMVDGSQVGPDLAVSVEAALRAITVNAARQIGLADALGTLEPGKEADLTILESDPVTADPEKIASIGVSETWVAGEKKFG
jgi:predicted amidohydrolase YtcJ